MNPRKVVPGERSEGKIRIKGERLMNSLLLLAALAPMQIDTTTVIVFGRDRWYQTVRGDEETFTGVLQRIPGTGLNSRNAFTLVMGDDGKNTTREVFIGADNRNLAGFLNRRVRITGMAVDLKVDGRMKYEIWPAKIELIGGGPVIVGPVVGPVGGDGGIGLIASADWQIGIPSGVVPLIGTGQVQRVAKSQDELLGLFGGKQAQVDAAYRALGVKKIDFRKNMFVLASGGVCRGAGHSVEITGLNLLNQTLLVSWAVRSPAGNPAVGNPTHPAKLLIIPRYDGPVRFDPLAKR